MNFGRIFSVPLAARELEVLKCIAEGHATKEVASMLGIAFKTAACHRYRGMDNLGIHSTASLVRYAIRTGPPENTPEWFQISLPSFTNSSETHRRQF
jgi:DNA-binding CsgD family transcriptional regulator